MRAGGLFLYHSKQAVHGVGSFVAGLGRSLTDCWCLPSLTFKPMLLFLKQRI